MASIVIKDLTESAELDRNAIAAVVGGAPGSHPSQVGGGAFVGKGVPIELSAPSVRTINERLQHSKCARD